MHMNPLDNPIWAGLSTHHAKLAVAGDGVARYPADVAPFAGMRTPDARAPRELERLLAPGEAVFMLGPVPELGAACKLETFALLPQMVCETPVPGCEGPAWVELT